MRSIKEAKQVKAILQAAIEESHPKLAPKVRIVFHENDLAFKLTTKGHLPPGQSWTPVYQGYPLLVEVVND